MVELATPVVLSELGWMAMGIVDTMVVGHLNTAAMGAVSIGGILFSTVAWTGAGLLLGLDTLELGKAFSAMRNAKCPDQRHDGRRSDNDGHHGDCGHGPLPSDEEERAAGAAPSPVAWSSTP